MISQQEIYDLDIQTLEQRVDFLQQQLRKWSPKSKRKAQKCLQLAKLQIQQRQADILLHEFENKLSTINFLYVHQQIEPPNNEKSKNNLNNLLKPFIKQKQKNKAIQVKKVFTIPKTDDAFQYKPIKPKKIPSINTINNNKKVQTTTYRSKANSLAIKPTNSIQISTPMKKQQSTAFSTKNIKQQCMMEIVNEKIKRQNTQNKQCKNKVEYFIQNEHSISSDQGDKDLMEYDIYKSQLILTSQNLQQNTIQKISTTPKIIHPQCQKLENRNRQEKQIKEKSHVFDTIDYFRFTIVKNKNQVQKEDIQSHRYYQQKIDISKQSIQQQFCRLNQLNIEPLQLQPLSKSSQQPIKERYTISLSQRTMDQIPIIKLQERPKTQHTRISKKHSKHQTVKLIKQPSVPTINYHEIIPTFSHIFPPHSDLFTNMRMLIGVLTQHLKLKPQSHNDSINRQKYQSIPYQRYYNSIDIQINRQNMWFFQDKQQEENVSTCLYYRVIKTKQEVYDIITNSLDRIKWYELPHGMNLKQSWNLLWTWSKPQIDFKTLIYFQKVNHFINNKQISRKDLLKKNIQKIKRLGTKIGQVFDIIPDTYLLPGEADPFIKKFQEFQNEQNNIWIMKPIGLSRGRGIRLVRDLNDIYYDEPVVLQKYLKNPLLLDGFKFDMRIYVLVTSINPLQTFLYKEGFARMSTQQYSLNNLDNKYVHLTNYSIQRQNINETQSNSIGGSKISLKMLRKKLQNKGIPWQKIWTQVIEIILKSLISCMNEIPSIANSFQLFGYDIIIDTNLKCWLLQVNSSPSLEKQYILDDLIKQQLTDDIIKLVNPINYNRQRLKQVFQRKIMQYQGRKSYINTNNNSTQQLNQDLCYILDGKQLNKYGSQMNKKVSNFIQIAPGDGYYKLIKILQSYKRNQIIKKI